MNKLEKQGYLKEISEYFERHNIHGLFSELNDHLLRTKPSEPIDALIDFLKHPKRKRIFVVGTPGCGTKHKVLQLSEHFGAAMISVGDLLKKEVVKSTDLGQQVEYYLSQKLYAPDEVVVKVLEKYLNQSDPRNTLFIEGFPKTVYQAKYLLANNLFSGAFIKVDFPESTATSGLSEAFSENGDTSIVERNQTAKTYIDNYQFHINETKLIFKNLAFEFDDTSDNLLEKLARTAKVQIDYVLRNPIRVVFVSEKGSSCESVSEKLARELGSISIDGDNLLQRAENHSAASPVQFLVDRFDKPDTKVRGFILKFSPQKLASLASSAPLEKIIDIFIGSQETFSQQKELEEISKRFRRNISFSESSGAEEGFETIIHEMQYLFGK